VGRSIGVKVERERVEYTDRAAQLVAAPDQPGFPSLGHIIGEA
jgi:hypothetical protein